LRLSRWATSRRKAAASSSRRCWSFMAGSVQSNRGAD